MGKFQSIKAIRQEQPSSQVEKNEPTPIRMPGRPAGKRSNPAFEPTTIFLRKATKKTANRTLEDSGVKQDLSELIESLLQSWISEHS